MIFASDTIAAPAAGPRVRWAFTDALGPNGADPYGGFNLGDHVGDDPATVAANRTLLADDLGVADVVYMNQVHGADVHVVAGPWPGEAPPGDAIVTRTPGLALAVLVADCVPVLLADPAAGIVAAAHAGRAGLVKGVVPQTVRRMRELGAEAIQAIVGPSICGRCYEVPQLLRADVASVAPLSASITWVGTPGVDVASGVVNQLADLDIPVAWVPGCTLEDERLYSYRRQARTGRFAGVIVLG